MKTLDKFAITLALGIVVLLSLILLPKFDAPLADSMGAGIATFLHGVWVALIIVFILIVLGAVAFVIIKFKHMGTTHVIYDQKDGQPVRAVIHKGQLVQIAPAGVDLLEIMKVQQQQAMHMQQHWKMIGTATTSMKKFMDEYEVGEEDEEDGVVDGSVETKLLEGPHQPEPNTIYKLIDQLRSQGTMIDEEESIVGYVDGEPLRGRLFDDDNNMVDSVFVAGDTGFGKSVFAVYMHALNVLHGGRTLIIDPDADLKQSLAKRLGPLADPHFLLCPIANTPESALHLLDIAEDELEDPDERPVLFLVDEFTMIMRSVVSKGKWAEVGKKLATLAEDYATRGRKRRRRVIVFGQMTKATRSGGTELRDSMTTVCFHLKKKRASMVLDTEEAEIAPTLKMGQVLVIPARASEQSYLMHLPFPDDEALELIARAMIESGRLNQASDVSKSPYPDELNGNAETGVSTPGNGLETPSEAVSKIIDGVFPQPTSATENLPNPVVSKEIRETIKRLAAMKKRPAHREIAQVVGLSGRNYGTYQQVCREEGIVISQAGEA